MKKKFLEGTPVPKIVTVLFFLWAIGFVGVVYVLYGFETQAQNLSIESRFGALLE